MRTVLNWNTERAEETRKQSFKRLSFKVRTLSISPHQQKKKPFTRRRRILPRRTIGSRKRILSCWEPFNEKKSLSTILVYSARSLSRRLQVQQQEWRTSQRTRRPAATPPRSSSPASWRSPPRRRSPPPDWRHSQPRGGKGPSRSSPSRTALLSRRTSTR